MQRVHARIALGLVLFGITAFLFLTHAAPPPTAAQGAGAPAAASASTPTVGDFVLRYARALQLAGERSSSAQALEALRAAGLIGNETYNLKARLTEGEVVRITRKMELDLVTQNPGREFSSRQTDAFFEAFGSVLASEQGAGGTRAALSQGSARVENSGGPPQDRNPNAADPREQGRGEKRGLSAHFPFP